MTCSANVNTVEAVPHLVTEDGDGQALRDTTKEGSLQLDSVTVSQAGQALDDSPRTKPSLHRMEFLLPGLSAPGGEASKLRPDPGLQSGDPAWA